jgi:hypothetical protein
MNEELFVGLLKSFFEKNLRNPISNRMGGWIFDDSLLVDLSKNSLPKLKLERQPSLKNRLGIGTSASLDTFPINLLVKANAGRKYVFSGQRLSAEQIVFFICSNAETLIKSSHAFFVQNGVLSVIATSTGLRYDFERNPVGVLSLEALFINE